MRARTAELSKQLVASARASEKCQLLTSIPGVGAVTASFFVAAIEDPANFAKSRSVGAWLGLTTRRYQSGEVDYDGHISRRGDNHLRGLLYEAATVILTRTMADSALRTWGLKLKAKIGFKRAAVAVARKLAVIMHTMLRSGELFDRSVPAVAWETQQTRKGLATRRAELKLFYPLRSDFERAGSSLSGRGQDHSVTRLRLPIPANCVPDIGRSNPRKPIMRRACPDRADDPVPDKRL